MAKYKYKVYLDVDNGLKWYPSEDELLEACGVEYEDLFFNVPPKHYEVMGLFKKFSKKYNEVVKTSEDEDLRNSKLELLAYTILELEYDETSNYDDVYDYSSYCEVKTKVLRG